MLRYLRPYFICRTLVLVAKYQATNAMQIRHPPVHTALHVRIKNGPSSLLPFWEVREAWEERRSRSPTDVFADDVEEDE